LRRGTLSTCRFEQNGSNLPIPPPPESSIVPQDNVWGTLKYCNASLALLDADTTPSTRGKMFLASFCLRWLVHVVGDVHQPLHTTQRSAISSPWAIRAATSAKSTAPKAISTLSGTRAAASTAHLDFDHPPTAAQFAFIHKQADDLRAAWPRTHFPNTTVDAQQLSPVDQRELRARRPGRLPERLVRLQRLAAALAEYMQAVVDTSGSQMALAAYRLVELVVSLRRASTPSSCQSTAPTSRSRASTSFASSSTRTYLYIGIGGTLLVLIALLVGAFCIGKRRAMQQRHGPFGFERLP
jgi:hypothetical protein